jgi:phosphoglycerol transferase MdoB-like AlkP superfamily enzyme
LNTPFSILKTIEIEKIDEKRYFSDSELYYIFNPIQNPKITAYTNRNSNIFIIILESFSKEYTCLGKRKSYTPFLDSLMNESLVFDNAFANGKKSIEGIPSIIAGIPALMNEPFITSAYCSNHFDSPVRLLKKIGYTSAFFHGGTNGTMGFDAFCSAAGFDNYFGRYEYNHDKDYDGNWGIWDEEFFQYTCKKVSEMKPPFLVTLFSLSSHHPYAIPEKYKNKFKNGTHPIHKSIQYTDYALKKFFESASKENWFSNTLFIITADHTGPSSDGYYSNHAGIFSVPILFYKPGSNLKGKDSRIVQHCDIAPTLLSYVGVSEPFFSFGNNILDSTSNRFVVNFIGDVYQFFENDYLLQFDGERIIGFYHFKNDSLLQHNLMGSNMEIKETMGKKLKAIIQVYTSCMVNNKLYAKMP